MQSKKLVAERDALVAELMSHRPPWWRPVLRARWRLCLREARSMDVSVFTEMMRDAYTSGAILEMAGRRPLSSFAKVTYSTPGYNGIGKFIEPEDGGEK